jgi:hypothetical protein
VRLIFLGPEFESSHLLHILHPGSGTRLPTGNCHHTFFVDLITQYDAKDKTYKTVPGSGGVSSAPNELEGIYAWNWAQNIWADSLM